MGILARDNNFIYNYFCLGTTRDNRCRPPTADTDQHRLKTYL